MRTQIEPVQYSRPDGVAVRGLAIRGNGPVVVIYGGLTLPLEMLRGALEQLSLRGRAGVAFELPGIGSSPRLADPSLRSYLEFIGSTARQVGGSDAPVELWGCGMAGALVLLVRDWGPGSVSRVVALAPTVKPAAPFRLLRHRPVAVLAGAAVGLLPRLARRMLARAALQSIWAGAPSGLTLERAVAQFADPTGAAVRIRLAGRLLDGLHDSSWRLGNGPPVHVLWGEQDRVTAVAPELLRGPVSNDMVRGAGHALLLGHAGATVTFGLPPESDTPAEPSGDARPGLVGLSSGDPAPDPMLE